MARLAELTDLRRDVGAAVDGCGADALVVFGKQLNLLGDLLAQFTRGRQHQRLHMRLGRVESLEEGQAKCCGLARPGLRQADEVAFTTQQVRDGLRLDVGGRLESELLDGLEDVLRKSEALKLFQTMGDSGAGERRGINTQRPANEPRR